MKSLLNISDKKAFNRKIIMINTKERRFEFYLTGADKFYIELENWFNK